MSLGKTILIVEDELGYCMVLSNELMRQGFEVVSANNGKEGLEKALTLKPDLIILDLLMPMLGGLAFMDQIRIDEWGKSVPIIVLTNIDADDDIIQNVVKNNPAYYFIKTDITLDDLIGKIKDLLKLPSLIR